MKDKELRKLIGSRVDVYKRQALYGLKMVKLLAKGGGNYELSF